MAESSSEVELAPLLGDVELKPPAGFRRWQRIELESVVLVGNLDIEVMGDHQHVHGKVQVHSSRAKTHMSAKPVRRVPRAEVFVTRGHIAVDIELERIGKTFSI